MKLYELTSGVIVAVLIALGAYQYVNRTTVEEEPVVTETENAVAAMDPSDTWYFHGDILQDVMDPDAWSTEEPTATCAENPLAPLPCRFETPTVLANSTALIAHFQTTYGGDEEEVLEAAETRKIPD